MSKALPLPASSQSRLVRIISLCLGLPHVLLQQGHVLVIIAELAMKGERASCMTLSGEGFGDNRPTTGLAKDEEGGGEEEGEAHFTPPSDLALLGRGDIFVIVRFYGPCREEGKFF
ncbi:hypothetical protein LIER_26202 [Lithospermum erythrorhizon]|uniref:Uncharacterized protein n=1 Tax=Lithospermum erythrorhizon TaxID=34254 RepID=A0AAV3R917_LITER